MLIDDHYALEFLVKLSYKHWLFIRERKRERDRETEREREKQRERKREREREKTKNLSDLLIHQF